MSVYYIHDSGVTIGPFEREVLLKFVASGRLNDSSAVRRDDGAWATLADFAELHRPGRADGEGLPAAVILGETDGMLRFACPNCSLHYAGEGYRGSRLTCSDCRTVFLVPEEPAETVSGRRFEAELADEIPEGEITCPHCWKSFPADRLLYISCHPALLGDPVAGELEQMRFLPVKFNAAGQPLDERGVPCTDMACPHCHLRIPSAVVDLPSCGFSIVGAPSSGKSCYLTALVHTLRRTMNELFSYSFLEVDPLLNAILDGYEKTIFMAVDRKAVAVLPKTQQTGNDFSNQVLLDEVAVDLPKPFIFELKPIAPTGKSMENCNVIFYDNAGEHFQPGTDVLVNPATRHLAGSRGIIFLFDPTNDAAMRRICNRQDPQMADAAKVSDQAVLLAEMINRIRRHRNMAASEKADIPLVIAVEKYDVWRGHFAPEPEKLSTVTQDPGCLESKLDIGVLQQVSFALRELMLEYAPAVVASAEAFFRRVWFVPVSNFGCLARRDENGYIGIVPEELHPIWVEEPFLILLHELGMIGGAMPDRGGSEPGFDCRMSADLILFRHPVTGKRVLLPPNYLGAVLEIGGKRYALPPARGAHAARRESAGDLWN